MATSMSPMSIAVANGVNTPSTRNAPEPSSATASIEAQSQAGSSPFFASDSVHACRPGPPNQPKRLLATVSDEKAANHHSYEKQSIIYVDWPHSATDETVLLLGWC